MGAKTQAMEISDLLHEVDARAGSIRSVLYMMQSELDGGAIGDIDERLRRNGNLFTLVDCAERYLSDLQKISDEIRDALAQAKKGGAA